MALYLIHFATPLRHARHYLGFADGGLDAVNRRLQRHAKGQGARLVKVVLAAGIECRVARVWPIGDRTAERQLKKNGHVGKRLCPVCRGEISFEDCVVVGAKQ